MYTPSSTKLRNSKGKVQLRLYQGPWAISIVLISKPFRVGLPALHELSPDLLVPFAPEGELLDLHPDGEQVLSGEHGLAVGKLNRSPHSSPDLHQAEDLVDSLGPQCRRPPEGTGGYLEEMRRQEPHPGLVGIPSLLYRSEAGMPLYYVVCKNALSNLVALDILPTVGVI